VHFISKIANLCDPDAPTLQTDRRTDGQTDRRTDSYANYNIFLIKISDDTKDPGV